MDETRFREWYATWANILGLDPDPDAPHQKYNWRAAFNAQAEPDRRGKWPLEFALRPPPQDRPGFQPYFPEIAGREEKAPFKDYVYHTGREYPYEPETDIETEYSGQEAQDPSGGLAEIRAFRPWEIR